MRSQVEKQLENLAEQLAFMEVGWDHLSSWVPWAVGMLLKCCQDMGSHACT